MATGYKSGSGVETDGGVFYQPTIADLIWKRILILIKLSNSVYLFAGFILPMAFTIFMARAMASKLGFAEYGIFLLVNAISTFINYVDLGLGSAVTKYTSEYYASGNISGLGDLLSSARILFFTAIGILGLLIFLVLGKWFLPVFHITGGSLPSIFVVFALAGGVFFINSIQSIYGAILTALQRFDLLTKISLASMVVTSLGDYRAG